jgi:hypothetical protein
MSLRVQHALDHPILCNGKVFRLQIANGLAIFACHEHINRNQSHILTQRHNRRICGLLSASHAGDQQQQTRA